MPCFPHKQRVFSPSPVLSRLIPSFSNTLSPYTNEPDEVSQFLILRRGGEVLYFRTEASDDLREHLDEFADIFDQYSELA